MPQTIYFHRTQDAYGCFSTFSKHKIFILTTWPTCEHYIQGQKVLDGELRCKILMEPSPTKAAQMVCSSHGPVRTDWDSARDDVMRDAIKAKVLQHFDVRETLLDTGDATLVNHTSDDCYLGDAGDGSGKNMLGRILMEVRRELTKDGPYDELGTMMEPPWLKHPEIERHSIGWRMGRGESCRIKFGLWYCGLSPVGREMVRQTYPEPKIWEGFYDKA